MPPFEFDLATLQVPRIATLATSPWPAWLWSADATRILWTNAVGAAIFGAANTPESAQKRFEADDPAAAQIARLWSTLPSAEHERLARLRGFGAGFGGALMCNCSRIVLSDGTPAILVVATERAGPSLSLAERVRRLFPDGSTALAAFTPDGALLYANAAAAQRLNGTSSLSALGIDTLSATALRDGRANGVAHLGQIPVDVAALRLGKDESRVLILTWATSASQMQTPAPPSPTAASASPVVKEPLLAEQNEPHDAAVTVTELPVSAAAPAAGEAPPCQPPAHEEPITTATPAADRPSAFRQSVSHDLPISDRRHPLRFVWQMDADSRFIVGSDEFMELVGPRTMAACGRLWSDIAAEMKLDPDGQVARAIATQETWSGIQIFWPVDDLSDRLPVELSGLPVFDRDHAFGGYRGFGVCRDVARINQLARARRARPIGFAPASEALSASSPKDDAGRNGAATATIATSLQPTPTPAETKVPAVEPVAQSERPTLGVTGAANVVPFRAAPAAPSLSPSPSLNPSPNLSPSPTLSPIERSAFRELAQELTTRLGATTQELGVADGSLEGTPVEDRKQTATDSATAPAGAAAPTSSPASSTEEIMTAAGETPDAAKADVPSTAVASPRHAAAPEQTAFGERVLLDRLPTGILVYRNGTPIYTNRRFLEWSGYETVETLIAAGGFNALFFGLGADALSDSGKVEKISIRTQRGNTLPLEGRLLRVPWEGESALALVMTNAEAEEHQRTTQLALNAAENEIRDLEHEVRDLRSSLERASRREAQKAAAAKADFLAKVSHEIRTPLNSMIGFAEVIMAERFGSIGNDRYREYLKDMHAAGTHMVSLLNDLLDLSKIETGQLDLTFVNIDLNDLTTQCVAIAQQQANRARVIVRSALAPDLPHVTADARSLRQIVLTLLSNAVKFTGAGGQVIVSTAITGDGEAVLRVRDTGMGMRDQDIEAVLDPFHPTTASPSWNSSGTGLGLPLTKALAEANRANFSIKSELNAGTLVEITFPSARRVAH
ncbi:MAG TPA: HAMP domain-containing sensor histidine kinase [Xanthobacteraceae bacterium]|nr:HAMP domain-containing sensor histidine kinase [Xanthobacteraceae bacterium]